MATHLPYITIESVIQDYLVENDKSIHDYFKVFHLAFRGLEQLGLDFFYRVQSVKLPINANFTVTLPADYLNWCKIGILNDNGAIITLKENNNMTTYADLLPNRIEKTNDPDSLWLQDGQGLWSNFWNGGFGTSSVLGVPSGEPFVGEFKVDVENGVIILNQNFQRQYLMLEYLCSPQQGGTYYLPVQFREALIAWLNWKMAKIGSSRYAWRIEGNLKHEFICERRNAAARWHPIRKQQIYQVSQELSRLAIKS